MDVIDIFGASRQAVPLSLPENMDRVRADNALLRLIQCETDAVGAANMADRQMDLCEELLWKASPADERLLKHCEVDTDGLKQQLAALDPEDILFLAENGEFLAQRIKDAGDGRPVIAVDTSLDARILVELERFLLGIFVPFLTDAYAQAVFINVTGLCLITRNATERDCHIQALRKRYGRVLRGIRQHDTLAKLETQMDELDAHLAE